MEMVKNFLMCASIAALAASGCAAADFSLTIGNPAAASGPGVSGPVVKKVAKNALFAVRLEECAALDQAHLSGVAEGVIDGSRVSSPITISAGGAPGVYVVTPAANEGKGVWVVSLSATCGRAKAGALVSIGPQGFLREKTKILTRPATKAEIEAALKD